MEQRQACGINPGCWLITQCCGKHDNTNNENSEDNTANDHDNDMICVHCRLCHVHEPPSHQFEAERCKVQCIECGTIQKASITIHLITIVNI